MTLLLTPTEDGGIRISAHEDGADGSVLPPAPPSATALVEGRGALLRWHIDGPATPTALVLHPEVAQEWLADVYGDEVAEAVRSVTPADSSRTLPADEGPLRAELRRWAHLSWARSWWPAGIALPPLSAGLIDAERILLTAGLEHLLDDEDAVVHALADGRAALAALAAVPSPVSAESEALARTLVGLAEDYGVDLEDVSAPTPAPPARDDWALAAGGATGAAGRAVASGAAAVPWAAVPAQTLHADADARWAILADAGTHTLRIEADAVAGGEAGPLRARFGPDPRHSPPRGVEVVLRHDGERFAGEVPVGVETLILPVARRTLRIWDERMTPVPLDPEPAEVRDAVLRFAAARVADPWSLAERALSAEGAPEATA
ncbi:hypothetical protein PFZ55_44845 [Streptomyces sp. MS2A]|nr:hypothetical protein [Streptomyces sp. MS2A]